jgi:hypothetical protein
MDIKITRNPFILFLPFLILYILIVISFPTNGTSGDEERYLYFAHNLINGYFSPPIPHIDLGNGPGYPIILIPFVVFHLPLISITLLNAILYYLSIVILFKALLELIPFKLALIISLFWALYYNSYQNIPQILTEVFTSSLICFLLYFVIKAFNLPSSNKEKLYVVLSGVVIGYIALTKPIFGYVILFVLPVLFILWLIKRKSGSYKKSLIIMVIAFITTVPYLLYTYHLTNRLFYWTSVGGNNIYWMTSPYENEYGSWISYPVDSINDFIPGSKIKIDSLHKMDFRRLPNFKGLQQDDILKKIAVNNIISHPIKFIENCISNAGRILFNFPFSYKAQSSRTLLRLPLTGTILVFLLFCIIPTILNWKKVDYSIRFLLLFAFVYLGGSIFGSAETRMFTVVVPILLCWIAYILQRTVKVKVRFD